MKDETNIPVANNKGSTAAAQKQINFNQERYPSMQRSNKNSMEEAILILNQVASIKRDDLYAQTKGSEVEQRARSSGPETRAHKTVQIDDPKLT